jgi:hypothetical protein
LQQKQTNRKKRPKKCGKQHDQNLKAPQQICCAIRAQRLLSRALVRQQNDRGVRISAVLRNSRATTQG